jgi:integrase/recombinase XerD
MGKSSINRVKSEKYRELSQVYYRQQVAYGISEKSSRIRALSVNEFLCWIERKEVERLTEVDRELIQDYQEYLSNRENRVTGGKLSKRRVYRLLQDISLFFEMLYRMGEIAEQPFEHIVLQCKEPYAERIVLSVADIQELYDNTINLTEQALLCLGYGCGLRTKEIERCNIDDLQLRDKILTVERGKGNKRRVIPLHEQIMEVLREYLRTERVMMSNREGYRATEKGLLLNQRGSRLRAHSYNRMLSIIVERSDDEQLKNKTIKMHTLRHSIATHLLAAGMPVEQVRSFLGHSQLETTQIYTHIVKEQLEPLL